MHLYNFTLQRPTAIYNAVHGSFMGTKQQEVCVARSRILELLRPDPNTGRVHTICSQELFGIVRSMMAFRLTGGTKGSVQLASSSVPHLQTACILHNGNFYSPGGAGGGGGHARAA